MKDNKYKIIALILTILFLCSVPVFASSLDVDSAFTSTGSYVGGWSYTSGSGYSLYYVKSYLFAGEEIKDIDSDDDSSWAQGDVGCNNPPGSQEWSIWGVHKAYTGSSSIQTETYADGGQS